MDGDLFTATMKTVSTGSTDSTGLGLKYDYALLMIKRCGTCAGATRVHGIPGWYVDIKVQV